MLHRSPTSKIGRQHLQVTTSLKSVSALYNEIQRRVAHQRQKCSEAMKKTVDQSELEIPQFVKERLIVDETRKMIYCPIPKAGSSNWKRIFIKLTHPEYEDTEDLLDIRGVHHIDLPTLDSLSQEKQEKVLKEYRKFKLIIILICIQVRMAERSKAPDSSSNLHCYSVRVFWSPIGGVGSNPTSDTHFAFEV